MTAAIRAGESDRADDAVAIDDCTPHVEVEAAVGLAARVHKRGAKGVVTGKAPARSGRCSSSKVARAIVVCTAGDGAGNAERRDDADECNRRNNVAIHGEFSWRCE